MEGFMVYAGVITHCQPWRGGTLFQYLDIIMKAYSCYLGDLGYCMMRSSGCGQPLTLSSLGTRWIRLQIMSGNCITPGEHSHSRHMVSKSSTPAGSHAPLAPVPLSLSAADRQIGQTTRFSPKVGFPLSQLFQLGRYLHGLRASRNSPSRWSSMRRWFALH